MNLAALVRFWLTMIAAAGALELFDFLYQARSIPDQGIVALNVVALLAWGATRRARSKPGVGEEPGSVPTKAHRLNHWA